MRKPTLSSETIHASCVALAGGAVLLAGRSGAGKSDLALRLIDRGAQLVSDDYTLLRRVGGRLVGSAPATIAGRIEVRGLGIVDMPHLAEAEVRLIVLLDEPVVRMPERAVRQFAGVDLPAVALAPLEASAPIKVELALARFGLPA
ncbi:HPr kinase/phosphorylase [Sphingomonas jatrophae]|uniref:Hpr(Ser) kinase/phosphatase n=1 Tax=Sphingomonas jatrophae TaxID=1166337 RepID=A0A1I6L686_9SPHN|nr:HPr kinase/phosphatase C-terminal domain-containing protein [Sphingomonas jatrophae]SFR98748.1 Hpr(Ser) kinase/phosphatase [Sphingomonas jatrophae]